MDPLVSKRGKLCGYVLDFGSNILAGNEGKYMLVDGRPAASMVDGLTPSSERVVPKAGNLNRIAWNSVTADETTVLKVLVEGVVKETVTLSGASGTAALTEAVALGDKLAIEWDAGTVLGNTSVVLYIE